LRKYLLVILIALAPAVHASDVLESCEWSKMSSVEHFGTSNQEASDACKALTSTLGRPPSKKLAGMMFKMLFGFKYLGYKAPSKDIAYQVMSVIEARGQINKSDEAMIKTINAIFKCYQGSDGHTTPQDFAVAFRAMSKKQASGLSDDFMYTMGAMIQEDKKSRGE
jgi:hypothetical protein